MSSLARDTASSNRIPLDVQKLPAHGIHLIEASAGTGKTYTITSLVLKLIAERGFRVDQVLAVTFTNAATAELRERISTRLSSALTALEQDEVPESDTLCAYLANLPQRDLVLGRLRVACQDVDCSPVFTIHGFAARVLKDFPLESGARADAELLGDQRSMIANVVDDFWLSHVSTLSRNEFAALGDPQFHKRLLDVARVAAGSFGVPRVPLNHQPGTLARTLQQLQSVYDRARLAFAEQGQELLRILISSKALNRTKMNVSTIEKEFAAFRRYLKRDLPSAKVPSFERLTLSKVLDSTKKNESAPEHPLLNLSEELKQSADACAAAAEEAKDELCAQLCDEIQNRLNLEHRRVGSQSFDHLLSDLCLALRHPDSGESLAVQLQQRYPIALIDEFQDTDAVQYEIFERIYPAERSHQSALFLIGDPKQSIYGFRGADVFTYLKAGHGMAGEVLTLTTSYRASPALVQAQNLIFNLCKQPFGIKEIVYDQVSSRSGSKNELLCSNGRSAEGLRIVYCPEGHPEWIVAAAYELVALLSSGLTLEDRPIRASDIAVLTRRNSEAIEMQQLLLQLGIPAVMHCDRSVFETAEAREVRQVLVALAQPRTSGALRGALSTRIFGLRLDEIAALDAEVETLELWLGRFQGYAQTWQEHGFYCCFEEIFRDLAVVPRTLGQLGGERRLTNLRHIVELLHDAESSQHLGIFGLLRVLEDAIFEQSSRAMAAEARQLRLESDDHAVVLTTAHRSKGLEYNIVVLPVLGKTEQLRTSPPYRFFDPTTDRALLEYRGSEGSQGTQSLHAEQELQEGIRLAYVALTRAKHQVITFVDSAAGYSPLRYLLFAPLLGEEIGLLDFYRRSKELKDHDLRAFLQSLVGGDLPGLLVASPRLPASQSVTKEQGIPTLLAPPAMPLVLEQESTSSFSKMTRASHNTQKSRQGRDQIDLDVEKVVGLKAVDQAMERRCILAEFPRGARPGEALHSALELSPFALEAGAERQHIVQQQLERYGLPLTHVPAVHSSIENILQVRYAGYKCPVPICLAQLQPQERFSEMEFNLPIGTADRRWGVARLVEMLSWGGLPESYTSAIKMLSFESFSGFLRGFIDLVYMHEGKLYALDYKSNFLGEHYGAYSQSALQQAMEEHHYLLQAVLYSAALHSYGKMRIADYDYERHFGGMHYMFLRGMHPDFGSHGIYAYRPARTMIERLAAEFLGTNSGLMTGGGT